MRRLPLLLLSGFLVAFPASAIAQNRVEQQIIADQRMLQEQNQQLKLLINTLAESVKAVSTRQDELANTLRKAFADQKLQGDAINDSIRILREKGDDTNVRISTISHEIEGLRTATQGLQNSVVQAMAAAQASTGSGAAGDPAAAADPTAAAPTTQPGVNPAMVQSPTEMYNKAYGDFQMGRYELTIAGFQGLLRTFPTFPNAYAAQFYIGAAYFQLGRYREALNAYRDFIETYKTSPWLPEAYYKRGLTYVQLSMKEQAKADFQTVVQKFPDDTFAALAKQQLDGIK